LTAYPIYLQLIKTNLIVNLTVFVSLLNMKSFYAKIIDVYGNAF